LQSLLVRATARDTDEPGREGRRHAEELNSIVNNDRPDSIEAISNTSRIYLGQTRLFVIRAFPILSIFYGRCPNCLFETFRWIARRSDSSAEKLCHDPLGLCVCTHTICLGQRLEICPRQLFQHRLGFIGRFAPAI